jgi:hypothetical protein
MSEPDSPDEGSGNDTALDLDTGAAAIEGLLSDVPETDSDQSEESQTTGQDSQQEDAGDDDLELDVEEAAEGEDAPEAQEFKGGRFASDDAKVTLNDGTTISVADLKAGFMFQRTFTEKTTALSQEKKAFEAERSQILETKNQLTQQREVILTLASELLPQEPVPPTDPTDYLGFHDYQVAKLDWDKKMGKLKGLWEAKQQEEAKLTKEQAAQVAEFKQNEFQKLTAAIPSLKDAAKRESFRQEAVEIGRTVYGLSEDEIGGVIDHRLIRVLADAVAYRKAIAKRDAKQPSVQTQQPRIQQRQRMAPTTVQARNTAAATDRLRKTGSLEDAANALMKFV